MESGTYVIIKTYEVRNRGCPIGWQLCFSRLWRRRRWQFNADNASNQCIATTTTAATSPTTGIPNLHIWGV